MTQKEAIIEALNRLGGMASLNDIYRFAYTLADFSGSKDWKATIRWYLQKGTDSFRSPKRGWYELLSYQEELAALKKENEELKESNKLLTSISVADDREIRMEGRHARYEEHSGAQATHFPQNHNEAVGKQWFDFLIAKGFIGRDSELDSWLYQMGFSSSQPAEVKPIAWLRTVETARMMLTRIHGNLLESKQLTVVRMNELASKCFTKQGEPLKLAKPRKEDSMDADAIEQFLPME